jgi:hypothetical protein
MKKSIIYLIIFIVTLSSCKTQNLISKEQVSVNGIDYKISGPYHTHSTGNHYIIKNINNKLEGTEAYPDKPKEWHPDFEKTTYDRKKIDSLVANELDIKQLKNLLPEQYFSIYLSLDEYGRVIELFFSVKAETKLKAEELANIEKTIKSKFAIVFKDRKSFEGINYFSMFFNPQFSDLLKIKQQQ